MSSAKIILIPPTTRAEDLQAGKDLKQAFSNRRLRSLQLVIPGWIERSRTRRWFERLKSSIESNTTLDVLIIKSPVFFVQHGSELMQSAIQNRSLTSLTLLLLDDPVHSVAARESIVVSLFAKSTCANKNLLRKYVDRNLNLLHLHLFGFDEGGSPTIKAFVQRNWLLTWRGTVPWLLDICIGMAALDLPVYLLLWIFDWIWPWRRERERNHLEKIRLIERVAMMSRARLCAQTLHEK